ncbi:MAG: PadR family transcriptional regulator [Anaerolineae bacterium]|nr:PadR family transcriptional regulator [Anaerolineae bacterium]
MVGTRGIRHFILGLLSQQPMSGYDIKRFLKSLSWLIDVPSLGSLYPSLHALLKDGLVTVKVIAGQDRPSRKIYAITEAGGEALQTWLKQPSDSNASLKKFVMRLALAGQLSQVGLLAHLEQRRARVAAHKMALEQAGETKGADLGKRLMLDYGLSLAAAELTWLDSTLARLSQPSLSAEAAENEESGFVTLTV